MSQQDPQLENAMNRRQFLMLTGGTTLGLAAFLAGCGSSTGGATNSNGSANIEFLTVQAPKMGWELILSSINDQYAKTHAGTTFKANNIPQTNLNQQVQLLAGSGSLPILYNTPSLDIVAQLEKNGQALDIQSTFQQLGVYDEILPGAATIIKQLFNNQMIALPFELNIEGFWYNKQIFSQNGLQPPTTWDELVQIATTLQQKGIQPFAASGQQGWPLTRLIGNYLFRSLGPDALAMVQSGKAKLTDPTYVTAAQAVANLGKAGYFGRGVATLDYATAENLYLQGKAAMFYMGSWAVADFLNPTSNKIGVSNVGFFPFPNVTGGQGNSTQTPMNCGQTTSVNKAKYNSVVGQWLANMAKNYGDVSLQKEGVVSGFAVHTPPANLDPLTTMVLTQIKQVQQPVLWFEAFFTAKATTLSQQDVSPLVTGSLSPAGFMSSVQGGL